MDLAITKCYNDYILIDEETGGDVLDASPDPIYILKKAMSLFPGYSAHLTIHCRMDFKGK